MVDESTLRRMHGPKFNPTRESMSSTVTLDMVMKCLSSVAPLTTPTKDGLRVEHLLSPCADQDCAATFTDMVAVLAASDGTDNTSDLLSSTTLVVLLKKLEAEMEALRRKQGPAYRETQRPLGMGSTVPKIAANCVLEKMQPAVGATSGAHHFAVNTKGGCDMVQ